MSVAENLKKSGVTLPEPATYLANYVPYVVSGNMVYVSGQIPWIEGEKTHIGKVGENATIEQAQDAARNCALNILAQVKAACDGDLEKVVRCVKLGGFVNATPDFEDQSVVINGGSDLIVEVLGDKGKHARAAVGVASLPFGVMVEIDAVFEITA